MEFSAFSLARVGGDGVMDISDHIFPFSLSFIIEHIYLNAKKFAQAIFN